MIEEFKHSEIAEVVFRGRPGATIGDVAREALCFAIVNEMPVKIDFNGRVLSVHPELASFEGLMLQWAEFFKESPLR